jgi:hypothetical protein
MNDDNVVHLPGSDEYRSRLLPREQVIEPAKVAGGAMDFAGELTQLVVIGVTQDGKLYAASSHIDTADNVLLLERFKRKLMEQFGEDEFV